MSSRLTLIEQRFQIRLENCLFIFHRNLTTNRFTIKLFKCCLGKLIPDGSLKGQPLFRAEDSREVQRIWQIFQEIWSHQRSTSNDNKSCLINFPSETDKTRHKTNFNSRIVRLLIIQFSYNLFPPFIISNKKVLIINKFLLLFHPQQLFQ